MLFLPAVLAFVTAQIVVGDKREPETLESITQYVIDLGSPSFSKRETATRQLAKVGRTAVVPVLRATESDDREVSGRAVRILRKLADGDRQVVRFLLRMVRAERRMRTAEQVRPTSSAVRLTATHEVDRLVCDARNAIANGRHDAARQHVRMAVKLKVLFRVFDVSTEVTLLDVRFRLAARSVQRRLGERIAIYRLHEARIALAKGNADFAVKKVLRAAELEVSYGPFDNSPELNLEGIGKRTADRLLLDARRAQDEGLLDVAQRKAQVAQRLEVSYSLFDDRPELVLADIDRDRAARTRPR